MSSSSHDRWRSVEELYQAALDRPASERAAFLNQACPNPGVRREVESLLGFAPKGDSLLQNSPWTQSGGLEPGADFARYRIEAKVGTGGMGEVYRAHDTRLGRAVALKILPASMTGDAERHLRFVREAQSLARLNHVNIVTVYDIGEREGRIYIAMEYVEGKTLSDVIPATGLPAADVLNYAIPIATALAKAHAAGVIHRDLKPGNIMVTSDGIVKVLDFGLAKLFEESPLNATLTARPETQTGIVMGTPAFMSPEQAEGKPVDARSDIFSFGALLYEMATGKRAFGASSLAATFAAVLYKEPEPLPDDIPRELSGIIERCLRKDPAARFQTMTEVRSALSGPAPQSETVIPTGASIAVLAFADLSPGHEHEYFSDGLSEEIISALSSVKGLKVIARTSAFAFKGKNEDIRRVASVLGVGHVLEGSVRRSGNRIRVMAQLINSSDGANVWSQRYDREITDIFTVQDEIAGSIVEALQLKLAPHAASRHTPDVRAYEAYMLGLYQGFKTTPELIARGLETLQQAAELDPAYAAPHAAQGSLRLMTAAWGLRPAHEVMPLVRASAQRALALDPGLSEAHALLGVVSGIYDYDWLRSERHFTMALGASRVPDFSRMFFSQYHLLPLGRTREAVEWMEKVLESDPLNLLYRCLLGVCLHAAGETDRAHTELMKALEIEGNHWTIYSIASLNHAGAGRMEEARAASESAYRLAPWQSQVIGTLAALVSLTEDRERSAHLLRHLRSLPAHSIPIGMATYHLVRSEPDALIDWLEKAIEQRDMWAVRLPRFQLANILRSSARWPAILRTMNLPES